MIVVFGDRREALKVLEGPDRSWVDSALIEKALVGGHIAGDGVEELDRARLGRQLIVGTAERSVQ